MLQHHWCLAGALVAGVTFKVLSKLTHSLTFSCGDHMTTSHLFCAVATLSNQQLRKEIFSAVVYSSQFMLAVWSMLMSMTEAQNMWPKQVCFVPGSVLVRGREEMIFLTLKTKVFTSCSPHSQTGSRHGFWSVVSAVITDTSSHKRRRWRLPRRDTVRQSSHQPYWHRSDRCHAGIRVELQLCLCVIKMLLGARYRTYHNDRKEVKPHVVLSKLSYI